MKTESLWIWNYGDYEIFHSNRVNTRREQYGAYIPCIWRLYTPDPNVVFYYQTEIETDGSIKLCTNGSGHIMVDNDRFASGVEIPVKKGFRRFQIHITNLTGLPAAFIESDILSTGKGWYTLDENMNKIAVGCEKCYNSADKNPEIFPFEYRHIEPAEKCVLNGGILFDFGKETFALLNIENVSESDILHISYGESREEALDTEHSLIFEDVSGKARYQLRPRAFRFVFVTGTQNPYISAEYEYLPLEYRGSFECDDESVNEIWKTCAYTMSLTSREVHLEAIKRDGWLWGGDAYQIYKFNNYLFFDRELIKRSTIALRGKEPVFEHINTITDYTFLWVIGLREYLLYYGDTDFIKFIYKRAVTLMDYASKRVNKDGFITKVGRDWIFIDWSDMDKDGALCAEQVLFIAANRTMAYLAEKIGEDGEEYKTAADELTEKLNQYFWNDEKGAFIDTYESGRNNVTRHANIFAVMFGIATDEQRKSIIENVLENDEITQITTPYFEGYELDVCGMLGDFCRIENKIKTYWKGMLDLGATTIWEEFDPKLSATEHYAMYGGKYAKSLCHAWGAAPIYLLGKYFLGVAPEADGFERFTVKPYLGSFEYIRGTVPVKDGEVRVYLTKNKLSVTASRAGGRLVFGGREYELKANEELCVTY